LWQRTGTLEAQNIIVKGFKDVTGKKVEKLIRQKSKNIKKVNKVFELLSKN
jgi:hypothetical protein